MSDALLQGGRGDRSGRGGRTTVVVGGGLTGLVAARDLAGTGRRVIVLEGSPQLGGKLARTVVEQLSGEGDLVGLDVGAESMLARRPEGLELIEELGLAERRATPTPAKPQALIGGRIRALPPSAMGVPTDLDALTGYLSEHGLARARREPELPAPALDGDVGIGAYVADRFGDEVTDRLLEPLLGGVYAGRSRELSFAAVNPALFARARAGGSLLAAAQQPSATAAAGVSAGPVFAGLIGGVTGLVDALSAELQRTGVEVRTSTSVRELAREGEEFRLLTGPTSASEVIAGDEVVLAVPAAPAGRLLADLAPVAARALGEIPYASVAVVTLLVTGTSLDGSGLLVPPGELPTVKALTYSHNKWPWIAELARRAVGTSGEPLAVVRASVGRYGEADLLQVDDVTLVNRTMDELRQRVPGWSAAKLVEGRVQRWGGGLPQYLVGHRERVAEITDAVDAVRGLAVAGAYLNGVGLPACIASGRTAASRIIET